MTQFNSAVECPTTTLGRLTIVQRTTASETSALRLSGDQITMGHDGEFAPAIAVGLLDDGTLLVGITDTCISDVPNGVYSVGPDGTVKFLAVSTGRVVLYQPEAS